MYVEGPCILVLNFLPTDLQYFRTRSSPLSKVYHRLCLWSGTKNFIHLFYPPSLKFPEGKKCEIWPRFLTKSALRCSSFKTQQHIWNLKHMLVTTIILAYILPKFISVRSSQLWELRTHWRLQKLFSRAFSHCAKELQRSQADLENVTQVFLPIPPQVLSILNSLVSKHSNTSKIQNHLLGTPVLWATTIGRG